jgi:hypothetical protein
LEAADHDFIFKFILFCYCQVHSSSSGDLQWSSSSSSTEVVGFVGEGADEIYRRKSNEREGEVC